MKGGFVLGILAVLAFALLFLNVADVDVNVSLFSVAGINEEVLVPAYGTVECARTRTECWPGECQTSSVSVIEKESVPNSGKSYWCGEDNRGVNPGPLTDSFFFEGCDFFIQRSGNPFLSGVDVDLCDSDGSNCQTPSTTTSTWGGESFTKVSVPLGKKVHVDPFLSDVTINARAEVYGIRIEGEGVKPQYSSNCNFASLLNDNQIKTVSSLPNYAEVINAGFISPGNFPGVVITGYRASYGDSRLIEINDELWFVEDVGIRCKVERDTAGNLIKLDNLYVSNACVADDNIQCIPNIGNCDSEGKLGSDPSKSCIPGTLIGSSTERVPVSTDKACKTICNNDGVAENVDCITIPQTCPEGKTLNQNYDCVDSISFTEKDKCELKGGSYVVKFDNDGKIVEERCDLTTINDLIIPIVLILVIGGIIIVFIVTQSKGKGKFKRRRR